MADRRWFPLRPAAPTAVGLAAALSGGVACAAVPSGLPEPFTAVYTLYTGGIPIAIVERRLQQESDGRFVFRSETRASGIARLFRGDHVVEESTWTVVGEHPRPLAYTYSHTGGDRIRSQTVTFDWRRQHIDNREDERQWRLRTMPRLLDKLLYQLAIMRDLDNGKRQLEYRFVDGGEIKTYRFASSGEERLATPLGAIETVKLERITEKGDRRRTTFWCAPRWGYLPVRLDTQDKSGRRLSAVIERWSGFGAKSLAPPRAEGASFGQVRDAGRDDRVERRQSLAGRDPSVAPGPATRVPFRMPPR